MLYNPTWNKQPSLADLVAWLETMPPEGEYNFANCQGACLIGQYMAHVGVDWYGHGNPYCETLAAIGDRKQIICATRPYTFGAALDRARARQRKLAS